MYSTLMVHLEPLRDNAHLLKVAAALAERFDAAVIGVAASQLIRLAYNAGSLSGEILTMDREQIKNSMDEAQAAFRAALEKPGRSLEWRSIVTTEPPVAHVARQARCADLVLTGMNAGGSFMDGARYVNTSDLVMQAGRPLLVVPENVSVLPAETVLVGWKDTREARRAVADALPFLKAARRVVVVQIAETDELADAGKNVADVAGWLARHGVRAEGIAAQLTGDDALQLQATASEHGADLIVAGAYGHARLREWALGGVTYDLLLRADVCTLLSH
jgi:nucleotide-binding universal stress UspA family protein